MVGINKIKQTVSQSVAENNQKQGVLAGRSINQKAQNSNFAFKAMVVAGAALAVAGGAYALINHFPSGTNVDVSAGNETSSHCAESYLHNATVTRAPCLPVGLPIDQNPTLDVAALNPTATVGDVTVGDVMFVPAVVSALCAIKTKSWVIAAIAEIWAIAAVGFYDTPVSIGPALNSVADSFKAGVSTLNAVNEKLATSEEVAEDVGSKLSHFIVLDAISMAGEF